MLPLDDLLVLDFSTLLPGPLASLFLAEARRELAHILATRPLDPDHLRARFRQEQAR